MWVKPLCLNMRGTLSKIESHEGKNLDNSVGLGPLSE